MYVNLGEYDDQDYVNFDMINDQEWWRIESGQAETKIVSRKPASLN